MIVELSEGERLAAASIGLKRLEHRRRRGAEKHYQDNGGTNEDRESIGAIAEYALAKHLGAEVLRDWCETKAYTDGDHTLIPCDVGRNLHVRATVKRHGGLILHDSDPDCGVFVLAIVVPTYVEFRGWAYARNVKRASYWRTDGPGFGKRPAYVMPQDALRPMSELPPEAI